MNIKKIGSDTQNWTIKQIVSMMDNKTMVFDSPIQRGDVWNLDQRSLLIHSAIYGYDIGNMCLVRTKEKNDIGKEYNKYSGYDGKQRNTSFYMYLKDEFALTEDTPPIIILDDNFNESEYEIAGKKYSELDSDIQDAISNRSLSFRYFEDLSMDEEHELFFRKNNGKPLTAIELTRVQARSIEAFQSIAEHPTMQYAISEKGKIKYVDEELAMQMWGICFEENPCFETKVFRPLIKDVEVTTNEMKIINECLDMINELYQEFDPETKEDKAMLRKLKARTHIVSLVYLAKLCIEQNKKHMFNNMATLFFTSKNGTTKDEEYNAAARAGSAKAESVKSRMTAIEKVVNAYN